MVSNTKESAAIIAKAYDLEVPVAEATVRNLLASEKKGGIPYWGPGDIRIDTMDNMIRAQQIVGALKGDADWSKLIDESFLPGRPEDKKEVGASKVTHVALRGVTRVYPGKPEVHALGPIDLELERGEFFAVVGPSGCGKSTLLDVMAGLAAAIRPAKCCLRARAV